MRAGQTAGLMTISPVVGSCVGSGGVGGGGALGVIRYPFPAPIGLGIGHPGGEPGFVSVLRYFPDHEISVAVLAKDDRADFNIVPRGKDIDTLVTDVLVEVLEHTTGGEVELEVVGAPAPAEQALTDELLAKFTAYVEGAVERWLIPGAAVAVVQDGEVV